MSLSNKAVRSQIIDRISSEAGLKFLLLESDCTQQQRLQITELVSILERREAFYQQAKRAEDAARRTSSIWRKAERAKHESERLDALRSYEKITDEFEAKIKALAQSVKGYLITKTAAHIDFERFFNALKERGIILQKIECPNCGGILKFSEVPKKEEVLQCRYCGKSILATNLFEKFMERIGL
jgi:DNA-directed RNA polymerase subunit RPC12/RpoP